MLSRPRRTSETSPAEASTFRCLVTACRVTGDPAVSRVIERGPSELSLATNASLVSSPSAAKIGAVGEASRMPPRLTHISRAGLQLLSPALVVHPTCVSSPCLPAGLQTRLDHPWRP